MISLADETDGTTKNVLQDSSMVDYKYSEHEDNGKKSTQTSDNDQSLLENETNEIEEIVEIESIDYIEVDESSNDVVLTDLYEPPQINSITPPEYEIVVTLIKQFKFREQ